MIEDRLVALIAQALEAAAPSLGLDGELPTPELLAPKQREHGDFATNVALGLAKRAGRPPREVAQAIVDALPPAPFLEKAEVAGPGFLNLFTTDEWLHDALRDVVAQGKGYGRAEPHGRRVQVELVSANPTGPLTLGHARNAAIGDTLARL
ncbi:MAG: arginine--tRNA ligase, partial [Actinobacteria bacterium]|nr:arginine--tRNA ligase [Actinomycetota bacterium]